MMTVGFLVSRVLNDLTVWVRDNEACLLLRRWSCAPVTMPGYVS
jgi:hypothetical protein